MAKRKKIDALGEKFMYPSRIKKGHTTLMIHNVPKRLKKMFKEACVRAGTTMRDALLFTMKQWAEGPEDNSSEEDPIESGEKEEE